jgi:regulatory protein
VRGLFANEIVVIKLTPHPNPLPQGEREQDIPLPQGGEGIRIARMTTPPISLKARALKFLAFRDLSTLELKRKLLPIAAEQGKTESDVDALIAEFQAKGFQSDVRFAQSLARRRSKFGVARLAQELKTHGLDKSTLIETVQAAKDTELERAHEAWQKKFGVIASDAKGRAQQQRFLASRGFSAQVVSRVLKGDVEELEIE